MMNNPWLDLPESPPYVLPWDHHAIVVFNRTADEATLIRLGMMPEPFLGNPSAPVVVLGLNPGFNPNATRHESAEFYQLSRNNLRHEGGAYPFYLLTPSLNVPGRGWWEQRLGRLIEAKGQKRVANGLLCVEYFPYHSTKFAHGKVHVPSQEYSFGLVRAAMVRNAIIVVMRAKKFWYSEMPTLATYARTYELNSAQNVTISPRNCPAGWAEIIAAL
ncbi:MAG: hypothetical protein IPK16_17550 [Anaerolineales bacterium]|nr:hypothetical protein [Anaerolineales bacterium]